MSSVGKVLCGCMCECAYSGTVGCNAMGVSVKFSESVCELAA